MAEAPTGARCSRNQLHAGERDPGDVLAEASPTKGWRTLQDIIRRVRAMFDWPLACTIGEAAIERRQGVATRVKAKSAKSHKTGAPTWKS